MSKRKKSLTKMSPRTQINKKSVFDILTEPTKSLAIDKNRHPFHMHNVLAAQKAADAFDNLVGEMEEAALLCDVESDKEYHKRYGVCKSRLKKC